MTRMRLRMLVLMVVVFGSVGGTAGIASANAKGGPLSGTWTGYIARQSSYGTQRQHMTITVNASESGGTWKLSATCHGVLTLDSISNGYHHYRRRGGSGGSCASGDIDCLKRNGAGLYDTVTSHLGGAWDTSGTLKRVR